MNGPIRLVGLGGTLRPDSSSEQALRLALDWASTQGATSRLFGGAELAELPMYAPGESGRGAVARELIAELRSADGVIVASPGYHGGISGLVKNALDYTEDLSADERPYLADRAVGLIVTANGWQAAVTTLAGLRVVVHALRGWATPYGAALNTLERPLGSRASVDSRDIGALHRVAEETMHFARLVRTRQLAGEVV